MIFCAYVNPLSCCKLKSLQEGQLITFACLMTLSYLQCRFGHQNERDHIYVSEYQTSDGPLSAVNNHDVPCAVCHVSTRGTVLMIPGKTSCLASWTQEYNGYLMAERYNYHPSMYECVDRNLEPIPGGSGEIKIEFN